MPASPEPKACRLRYFVLVLALTLLFGTSLFGYLRLRALPVRAMAVVRGQAVEAVYAIGSVEAENRVEVKAQTGGSIIELLVRQSVRVKKGDLIARIDNPGAAYDLLRGNSDLNAAHQQAANDSPQLAVLQAQARSIRAELEAARVEWTRSEQLRVSGGVPQADVDRRAAKVEQLRGNLDANAAQQRTLRIDLTASVARHSAQVQSLAARVNDSEVRAPLDGVVLVRRVELGEVVSVNQPLFLIGDTRSLILEVSVDEADVARISDGADGREKTPVAVSLLAFPKQVFRGQVVEVSPDADRSKKAFLVKVRFATLPAGLRSGMTAEVNMITNQRMGLLAPASAEINQEVWLAKDESAHKRKIKIGIRDPLRIEILQGLAEGDLVIVEGRERLSEGALLRVSESVPDKLQPMPDTTQPARTSL